MIVVASAQRVDSLHLAFALHESGLSVLGANAPTSHAELLEPTSWWDDPFNAGVFFETNPHRSSGRYLHPEPTASSVVVMSPEGVTMSDPAYLDRVIVVVRPWRTSKAPLEWLSTIYDQLADSALRRYPTWIRVAEHLCREPHRASQELVSFVGEDIALTYVEAALAELQTRPELRVDDPNALILDEVYGALREGTGLSDALVARVNEVLNIE